MKDEEITLTREALYELVWSKPMSRLAPEFGISDVALTKRCKRLGIPYPGIGYWARVAAGQKLKQPKLPPAPKHLGPYELTITFRKPSAIPPEHQEPEPPPPEVVVADTLRSPHAVVAQLRQELSKAHPDPNGLLRVSQTRATDTALKIGRDSISRTLRLFDALFKALEKRGHSVELQPHHWEKILKIEAIVSGQRVELNLEEIVGRRAHVATDEEKRNHERWRAHIPKNDGYPSGQLRLRVSWARTWSDTRRDRLENLLGRVVIDTERAAQAILRNRLERERREAEQRAEAAKRIRQERLRWYSRYLAQDLQAKVENWIKAREIREFLGAYEHALGEQRDSVAERWLAATKAFVESNDPLKNLSKVAMELEPSEEVLEELWNQYGPKDSRASWG